MLGGNKLMNLRVTTAEQIEKFGEKYVFIGKRTILCLDHAKKAIGVKEPSLFAREIGNDYPICIECMRREIAMMEGGK
jgi:hypothetical protein